MKVIKRDGRVQEFELQKIIRTIEYASDEVREPLTASDVEVISENIEIEIKNRDEDSISVIEIQEIILNELRKMGFSSIAEHYRTYKENNSK